MTFPFPLMPPTRGSIQLTYLSSAKSSNTNQTTPYSFSSVGFGVESADRYLLLCVGADGDNFDNATPFDSVTIGGQSPTALLTHEVRGSTISSAIGIYLINLPTGASGTITINPDEDSGDSFHAAYALYHLTELESATPLSSAMQNSTSPSYSGLVIPTGAIAVAVSNWKHGTAGYFFSSASRSFAGPQASHTISASIGTGISWAGIDEDVDTTYGSSGNSETNYPSAYVILR